MNGQATRSPFSIRMTSSRLMAATVIFAALGMPLAGCSSNPVPEDVDSAVAPAASPAETDTVAEQVIPTIESGLDAADTGAALLAAIESWDNASANDDLLARKTAENTDWDIVISKIAAENRQAYADALFVPGWADDPALVDVADAFSQVNSNTLLAYVATAWNGDEKPENKEGYRRIITPNGEAIDVEDGNANDGERTIYIPYIENSNEAMNSAEPWMGDDVPSFFSVKLQVQADGTEKIAALQAASE